MWHVDVIVLHINGVVSVADTQKFDTIDKAEEFRRYINEPVYDGFEDDYSNVFAEKPYYVKQIELFDEG